MQASCLRTIYIIVLFPLLLLPIPFPRLPSTDTHPTTLGRMENNEQAQHATVIVPRGRVLRSTVTFSDLSGGYETVRREYDAPPPPLVSTDDVIPTTAEGRLGAAPLRTYEIIDDPNSMAVFVVKPSNPARPGDGAYEATVMISHRKLRTLFKNAVDWYLKAKGLDPDEPRFYRLAQIDQSNRSRANVQWRYMTFHLPDDLNTRAPLTKLLDRMDRSYVKECWAIVRRKVLQIGIIFLALFVVFFLLLA